jgi:hypothetical protein
VLYVSGKNDINPTEHIAQRPEFESGPYSAQDLITAHNHYIFFPCLFSFIHKTRVLRRKAAVGSKQLQDS